MRQGHVVVLSVSAGAGHVRAAQARARPPSGPFHSCATHVDVMDLVPAVFRKVYADSYMKLVENVPLLWAYLYRRTDRHAANIPLDRLRRGVERLNTRKLDAELARLAPQAIICTHFLPAQLLSRRIAKGRATPPVWVQVTDFDVHGCGSIRTCRATSRRATRSPGACAARGCADPGLRYRHPDHAAFSAALDHARMRPRARPRSAQDDAAHDVGRRRSRRHRRAGAAPGCAAPATSSSSPWRAATKSC